MIMVVLRHDLHYVSHCPLCLMILNVAVKEVSVGHGQFYGHLLY